MKKIFCVLIALLTAASAQAGFIGRMMDANYYYPDASTSYQFATFTPNSFVIGGGIETTGDVEGVTTLPVDFSDNSLTITLNTTLSSPTWNSVEFNGIIFNLLSGEPLGITGASIDPETTLPGFGIDRVTYTDTQVGINWQGLSYRDGNKVVVNFTFAPAAVPEPSTLILAGIAGLAGLGGLIVRSRRLGADPIRAAKPPLG